MFKIFHNKIFKSTEYEKPLATQIIETDSCSELAKTPCKSAKQKDNTHREWTKRLEQTLHKGRHSISNRHWKGDQHQ